MIVNKITLKVIKSDVLHIEVAAAKVIQNCDQALVYSMPLFLFYACVSISKFGTNSHRMASFCMSAGCNEDVAELDLYIFMPVK